MTSTRVTLAVLLSLVSSHALAQAGGSKAATPIAALEGTSWRAVELAGLRVALAGGRDPHLVFGAEGRLSGSDGCNRITGTYSQTGDRVTFGPLVATQMACPDTSEVERRFRSALTGTDRWRVAGNRLEFYGATGKPLAVFERREQPPPSA